VTDSSWRRRHRWPRTSDDDPIVLDSPRPVPCFLDAAQSAIDLIASAEVARRWTEPSVLPGYRVGGLAGHLGRAVTTVVGYLAAEGPDDAAPLVDAAGYYAAVLQDHDPVTSELHAAVRARGEQWVEDGHEALVASLRSTLRGLEAARLDPERPLVVLAGTSMKLGDYLESRVVELAVHGVDLAESVGVSPPPLPNGTWEVVARVMTETALRRHAARAIAMSLARPDRTPRLGAF
jgi:hypothetical protein